MEGDRLFSVSLLRVALGTNLLRSCVLRVDILVGNSVPAM